MTFGDIRLAPGASNVVPGLAAVVSEVRSPDPQTLHRLRAVTTGAFEAAARAARLKLAVCDHQVELPEALSPGVAEMIERSARDAGLASMRLPSGAVHDAQMFAPLVPTGMIFVPSRDGISHHPDEYTAPDEIAAGTLVLLRAAAAALTVDAA
jgi:acetylornithine deacetylase/succinyl-diaminopimelate desuccinylase-like protein